MGHPKIEEVGQTHTRYLCQLLSPPLFFEVGHKRWDAHTFKKVIPMSKYFIFLQAVFSIIRALGISWFRSKISIWNQIPLKTSDNLNVMWRFFRMFLSFSIAYFRHKYSKFFIFEFFFNWKKQFTYECELSDVSNNVTAALKLLIMWYILSD